MKELKHPVCYIDSSLLLENIFSENGALVDLEVYGKVYSSRLLQTECIRVTIRNLLSKKIVESSFATSKTKLMEALSGIVLINIDDDILSMAETPFPVHLMTLDSIHLATALTLKKSLPDEDFYFLTYDQKLGKAAQVMGLQVLGI